MDANVGETLTIRGRNFKRGRNKNTVVFKRDGARAVFVKADVGTAKLLKRQAAREARARSCAQVNGAATTTALPPARPRRAPRQVLHDRPAASPEHRARAAAGRRPSSSDQSGRRTPTGDCDGDGRSTASTATTTTTCSPTRIEKSLGLDPCKPDTDGDGVAGRLRVPLRPGPQRRRVPGAQRLPALPGQAAVPEPARRRRRRRRLRRRRADARARSTASGSSRSASGAAARRSAALSYSDGRAVLDLRPRRGTAAAARRWPPPATTSRPTFLAWAVANGYRTGAARRRRRQTGTTARRRRSTSAT